MRSKGDSCENVSANKEKLAYRNYFTGTYYYKEDRPKKALNYFQKAYSIGGDQIVFAMAYAMALAETNNASNGINILSKAKRKLSPLDSDYWDDLITWHYVDAIVKTKAERYTAAQSSIAKAARLLEKANIDFKPKQSAGIYNLMGYLSIMNQESPKSHAGLSPHVHIQKQDMSTAMVFYQKAIGLDSSRTDAKENLKHIADSLDVAYTIHYIEKASIKEQLGAYDFNKYPHLPDDVATLIPLGEYDELLYLLDISGSMVMENVGCIGSDRFTIMKEVTAYTLDFLPDSTIAGLATIGGTCESEPSWWIATDSLREKDLRFEIENLNSDGTTPLLTTLVRATELFSANENTAKSIFFISDGEDVCGSSNLDICEWAAQLAEQNITINVLSFLDRGLSSSGAFAEYSCLAKQSGGQVYYLDPISCRVNGLSFDLTDDVSFELPKMERVECWGKSVKNLWAIYRR